MQKTAYEMRISDWSSDVCSSDLVFIALQQARDSAQAVSNGFHGQLRVALSDGISPTHLSELLALCRQDEPEIDIRFFEVPLAQQIKGLHDDLYDVGFAQSEDRKSTRLNSSH